MLESTTKIQMLARDILEMRDEADAQVVALWRALPPARRTTMQDYLEGQARRLSALEDLAVALVELDVAASSVLDSVFERDRLRAPLVNPHLPCVANAPALPQNPRATGRHAGVARGQPVGVSAR